MLSSQNTLPQDFTLFILMKEMSIDIWKYKLDWIAEKGGMVLLNTHPDYMDSEGKSPTVDEYPCEYYQNLLEYLEVRYRRKYWNMLPKDMVRYWLTNFYDRTDCETPNLDGN